jgi:uncharacterized protein with FMN-binding domain
VEKVINNKVLLSLAVLGMFGFYTYHLKTDEEENVAVAIRTSNPTPTVQQSSTPSDVVPGQINPSPPTPTIQVTSKPSNLFKDGTYTGNVADAFYGNIQVQAIVTDGKITDVVFLQYPNDRRTSIEINKQAMPLLKQEAIQAQSAKVDGVSGASQTSVAFIESLTNALKQAV